MRKPTTGGTRTRTIGSRRIPSSGGISANSTISRIASQSGASFSGKPLRIVWIAAACSSGPGVRPLPEVDVADRSCRLGATAPTIDDLVVERPARERCRGATSENEYVGIVPGGPGKAISGPSPLNFERGGALPWTARAVFDGERAQPVVLVGHAPHDPAGIAGHDRVADARRRARGASRRRRRRRSSRPGRPRSSRARPGSPACVASKTDWNSRSSSDCSPVGEASVNCTS